MTIAIEGKEAINHFQLLSIRRMISLELKTTMRHSRGCPTRTALYILNGETPTRVTKGLRQRAIKLIEDKLTEDGVAFRPL